MQNASASSYILYFTILMLGNSYYSINELSSFDQSKAYSGKYQNPPKFCNSRVMSIHIIQLNNKMIMYLSVYKRLRVMIVSRNMNAIDVTAALNLD